MCLIDINKQKLCRTLAKCVDASVFGKGYRKLCSAGYFLDADSTKYVYFLGKEEQLLLR